MSDDIPDKFDGFILKDGRCVSLEDAEALYREIVANVEELLSNHREEVEREIQDIAAHLAAAIDARKKLMQ